MKKLKKIILGFFKYFGTFLASIVCVAGVMIANHLLTQVEDDPSIPQGTETVSSIEKIFTNLENIENGKFDVNVTVDMEGTNILLEAGVIIDRQEEDIVTASEEGESEEKNDIKIQLAGNACYNEMQIPFSVTFVNNFLYAEIAGENFKIQTTDLLGTFDTILKLDIFDFIDFDISLSSLNWETIKGMVVGLGRSAKSVEFNDGYKTPLSIMDYGVIDFITDVDFNLKEISIAQIALDGVEISGGVTTTLNDKNIEKVYEPENAESMTDLTQFDKVIKSVDSFMKQTSLSGKIDVSVDSFSHSLNYSVDYSDTKNIKLYIDTEIFGQKAYIIFENNTLYVAYDSYKLSFDFNEFDFNGIVEKVKTIVGDEIEIPQIEIGGINIQDIDAEMILSFIASNFKQIVFEENKFSVSIEKAELNIFMEENNFTGISVKYAEQEYLNLTLNEEIDRKEFNFDEFDNINQNLISKVEKLIKKGCVSGEINIAINEFNQIVKYKFDFENEINFYAQTEILGQNAYLEYKDGKVYFAYDAYKYYFDMQTFDAQKLIDTVKDILSTFEIDVEETTNSLKEKIESLGISFEDITIENMIMLFAQNFKNFTLGKDEIALNVEKAKLAINSKNNIFDSVTFDYDEIRYLTITLNDEIEKAEFDYEDFEDVNVFLEKLEILANQIKEKKFGIKIDFSYGEYAVSGRINYAEDEISAEFSTIVMNRELNLSVVDNTIFVNFDGFKLLCALDDIPELVNFVCGLMDIDISEVDLSAFENIDIKEITSQIQTIFKDEVLTIEYKDILAKIDVVGLKLNQIFVEAFGTETKIELCEIEEISKNKEGYINLAELQPLVNAMYNTFANLSISGTINVAIELFEEVNNIEVDYSIGYRDDKIIGYIETEFKGLKINIYFDGEEFYFNIVGLKFKVGFNDVESIIDWLNETFDLNISKETLKKELDKIIDKIMNMKLDFIQSLETVDNFMRVIFKNGTQIDVTFDDYVRLVYFKQGSQEATLTCTDFSTITLDNLKKSEFKDYTEFTNIITNFYNFIMTKQYDVDANINILEGDVVKESYSADIQLDVTGALDMFAYITGLGDDIQLIYEDKVAYLCYGGAKGLKICIEEKVIQEVLGIVCEALNIDTSKIPFLDDFLIKQDLDSGNLSTLLPTVEFGNPLQYLEYIQEFEINDGQLSIILRGEKIFKQNEEYDIRVNINHSNNMITSITLANLFISENESISGEIIFNNFENVTKVEDKTKYVNLSNSIDLIKAFINTSQLDDYHISGNVILNLSLGSLSIDAAEVGVDIAVKLDEDKKPIIAVEVTKFPIIVGVTNKNSNGAGATGLLINQRHRTISIYYQNNEIIIKTFDEHWGAYDELTRVTKVSPKYLFNNLSYYMQWIFGFTDLIQNEIDTAIETSNQNRLNSTETDYEDIILNYTKNGDVHSCDINIGKLAYNEDIGTLHVDIGMIKNEATNNKEYIGELNFTLGLLDDQDTEEEDYMIILKTNDSNKLNLVDIGEKADVSKAVIALNDETFVLDGEYQKTEGKNWQLANQGERSVTLYVDGSVYGTMTGNIGTKLELPVLEDKIIDDKANGTYKRYVFAGWFTEPEFVNKYTALAYPRYDADLYAKWELAEDKVYVQINFVTNQGGVLQESMTGLNGSEIKLPTLQTIEEKANENISRLTIFVGWYLDAELTQKFDSTTYPNANITLYAKWSIEETATYNLKVIFDGEVVYNNPVPGNVEFNFPTNAYFKSTTKYFYDEAGQNEVTNFVINENTIWYARNYFTYTVKSSQGYKNGGEKIDGFTETYSFLNGDSITLSLLMKDEKAGLSYDTEYIFKGYKIVGTDTIISAKEDGTFDAYILPAKDLTFEAVWEEKYWCDVTFDLSEWVQPSWWTVKGWQKQPTNMSAVSNTNGTNKTRIEKGKALVFSDYYATCDCKYAIDYSFETIGWEENTRNLYDSAVSSQKYEITELAISAHITLKPVWKHK